MTLFFRRCLPLLSLSLAAGLLPALAQTPPTAVPPPVTAPAPVPTPSVITPPAPVVKVQELSAIDPNSVGVLDDAHGGFGIDLWGKSDIALVEALLPLIPAPSLSPSALDLDRRLLLSIATVPAGKGGATPLIQLRAEKLWALGDLDGLTQLLKIVPNSIMGPGLRRLQVDSALLANDVTTACSLAPSLNSPDSTDFYPLKLQAFCQLLAGKTADAALTIDLVRDQKPVDTAFFAAADALRGLGPSKGDSFGAAVTPLTFAMANAAKQTLPDMVAATPIAALWPALLQAPNIGLEGKLSAAEKAEAAGLIGIDSLRDLYGQVPFQPQDVAQAVASTSPAKGPRGRALLYRAASEQFDPVAAATVIGKALSQAEGQPNYFTVARLYGPAITAVPQTADLAWFAPHAARALLASGHPDLALGWISLTASLPEDKNPGLAASLWPLSHLAQPTGPATAAELAAWRNGLNLADPVIRRRAMILTALLSGLGEPVTPADLAPLFAGPAIVGAKLAAPAFRFALLNAQSRGERILTIVTALPDLAQADPVDLGIAVRSLHDAGLDKDARAFALEAALVNGL